MAVIRWARQAKPAWRLLPAGASAPLVALVARGAPDSYRPAPVFTGLTRLGLEIGVFCDFLHSVLLLSAIMGLDFLGRPLLRPQVECVGAATAFSCPGPPGATLPFRPNLTAVTAKLLCRSLQDDSQ